MLRFTLGICTSLLLLTAACQNSPATDTQEITQSLTDDAVTTVEAQQVMHLSTTDTLPYPIVANFDNLAPIFEQKDGKT